MGSFSSSMTVLFLPIVIGLISLNRSTVQPASGFLPSTLFPSLPIDKGRVQCLGDKILVFCKKAPASRHLIFSAAGDERKSHK
jgi:hypothetical protein